MKLTKEQLKRLIKEELESVVQEATTTGQEDKIMKAAVEMKDNPNLDKIFLALSRDPKVKKIVAQTDIQVQKNEEGGVGLPATATSIIFAGYPSMTAFLASAAGKVLLAKTAVVMGTSLATLGTAAIGFLAPVAVAFLLDVAVGGIVDAGEAKEKKKAAAKLKKQQQAHTKALRASGWKPEHDAPGKATPGHSARIQKSLARDRR